ncbi:hypothetical protein LB456_00185 [Psychroflexus sp. CAK57W]|uniref:hypothetical protein n=1 Tax=Psychroflexus curvus TaxID=2873595 RepID=UPI001CC9CDE3|nr:hypothetical protein [Psychroflexus curvus]MBZ9785864.1 hypothetical protein [Psychroflexus curvus]
MAELISIEELNEQLQLKPRFKVEVADINIHNRLSVPLEGDLFQKVEIKRLDDHIWLSIIKADRTYYSPRLHIEIEQKEKVCILHCTFGPDPNLWTMFMFVHFFLGLSFMALLVWLYTNITLDNTNTIVYILMSLIALSWIFLYIFARQNRQKAAPQSKQLLKAFSKLIR